METAVKAQVRKLDRAQLVEELAKLEREHSMTSAEFYARYREGKISDTPSFTHWASLCYMAMRRGVLTSRPQRA